MNAETLTQITKEAEEKYPLREMPPNLADNYDELRAQKDVIEYNSSRKIMIKAYIAGATAYAERAEKLRECLQEISMIVTNGAYNSEILENKINSTLNNNL